MEAQDLVEARGLVEFLTGPDYDSHIVPDLLRYRIQSSMCNSIQRTMGYTFVGYQYDAQSPNAYVILYLVVNRRFQFRPSFLS